MVEKTGFKHKVEHSKVKQKPNNPNTLYAITASEFYKSNNGGDSFVVSGTGLYSESARLVLDVTAANENLVYVVASTSNYGFEESTDHLIVVVILLKWQIQ